MGKKEYFPIETYEEAAKVLEVFSTMVLFNFARQPISTKDTIIRNFIARSIVALKGILELWKIDDYIDCWILYRCILDRFFHLTSLAKDDAFEMFEEWCFKEQYEYMNKVKSDSEFRDRGGPDTFKEMDKHKARYAKICGRKNEWKRPKAEISAKIMGLDFLYKYGYDYASGLVHPMANDGEEDFLRLTKLADPRERGDKRLVLNNSCLSVAVLIQTGLNTSSFAWLRIVFDFLTDYLAFLNSGSRKYLVTFCRLGSLGPNAELCKKTDKHRAFDG